MGKEYIAFTEREIEIILNSMNFFKCDKEEIYAKAEELEKLIKKNKLEELEIEIEIEKLIDFFITKLEESQSNCFKLGCMMNAKYLG